MELCNKKRDDGIWMDEVAALQACAPSEFPYFGRSGINFASEHNDVTQDIMMNRKQNGSIDASTSDTISHGSFDTNQENGAPSHMQTMDGKSQPMWPNHLPQYVQNFQNPAFQQIPPYPGYIYSGMQASHTYYPGMLWPANVDDSSRGSGPESDYHWKNKPPKNRKKYSNESDKSVSHSDSDDYKNDIQTKKHGKSSSRKVVIRNINYIASKRNGQSDSSSEDSSDDEDGSINAGSIKQQVEEAVGSWERHHNSTSRNKKKRDGRKKNSSGNGSNGAFKEDIQDENTGKNWDIFQNILLKDADSRSNDTGSNIVQEEYLLTTTSSAKSEGSRKQWAPSTDSFIVTERHLGHEDNIPRQNIGEDKSLRPVRRESTGEELLFSHRTQEPEGYRQSILSHDTTGPVVLKSQKEEDWLAGNLLNKSSYEGKSSDQGFFVGDFGKTSRDDHLDTGKDKTGALFDDSIMVQARSVATASDYHRQTDIFMASDIVGAERLKQTMPNPIEDKHLVSSVSEPNDLFMVLGRDPVAEQESASRNPEVDYENDVFLTETLKNEASVKPNGSIDTKVNQNGDGTNKSTSKELGRKAVSKEPKSESLVGSLGRTKSEISSRIKRSPSVTRTASQKSKADKDEASRKKLEESLKLRQKRIAERSANPGSTSSNSRRNAKDSATSSKFEKPKAQAPTEATNRLHKPVCKSSTIDRLASTRTAKDRSTEPKVPPSRKASQKENNKAAPLQKTAGNESKQGLRKVRASDSKSHQLKPSDDKGRMKKDILVSEAQKEKDGKGDIELISNELGSEISPQVLIETVDVKSTEETHNISISEKNDVPMVFPEHSIDEKKHKVVKFAICEVEKPVEIYEDNIVSPQMTGNEWSNTNVTTNEISTTPPDNETNQGRRKWMTDESSLKVTKGFRKLLLFGRKS